MRNGSREKKFTVRIGSLVLNMPRYRGQPFKALLFKNYSRREAVLLTCMGELVVNGISTRKVSNVMEALCGTTFSKSTISEECKALDVAVTEFRDRPLE